MISITSQDRLWLKKHAQSVFVMYLLRCSMFHSPPAEDAVKNVTAKTRFSMPEWELHYDENGVVASPKHYVDNYGDDSVAG